MVVTEVRGSKRSRLYNIHRKSAYNGTWSLDGRSEGSDILEYHRSFQPCVSFTYYPI